MWGPGWKTKRPHTDPRTHRTNQGLRAHSSGSSGHRARRRLSADSMPELNFWTPKIVLKGLGFGV